MTNQADLDQLRRQESYKVNEICTYENKNAVIDEKLERLRKAKNLLVQYEDEAKEIKRRAKSKKEKDPWKGNTYDDYKGRVSDLCDDLHTYERGIDEVIDAINTVITELRNDRLGIDGLLGDAIRALDRIRNSIVNFFN